MLRENVSESRPQMDEHVNRKRSLNRSRRWVSLAIFKLDLTSPSKARSVQLLAVDKGLSCPFSWSTFRTSWWWAQALLVINSLPTELRKRGVGETMRPARACRECTAANPKFKSMTFYSKTRSDFLSKLFLFLQNRGTMFLKSTT